MGTVLDLYTADERTARIYVTGDTLDVPELDAVRERFDGIDAMVIHLGGTRVLGVLVTLDDRQGCDLVERISAGASCRCTTTTTASSDPRSAPSSPRCADAASPGACAPSARATPCRCWKRRPPVTPPDRWTARCPRQWDGRTCRTSLRHALPMG